MDYPALLHYEPSSAVDGPLLQLRTQSQSRKLDKFEGESYAVSPVTVIAEKNGRLQWVKTNVYLWNRDALEDWTLTRRRSIIQHSMTTER